VIGAADGTVAAGASAGAPAGTVLVLRAIGLGDALTGVAALRGVRRAWPGRRVVLAAPAGLGRWLASFGLVDDVLPTAALEPLAWGAGTQHPTAPEVAVNLHGSGPQSHRLLQRTHPGRLVAFGCREAGHDGPAWDPGEHEVLRWCRLVRSAGGECGPADLRLGPPDPPGGRGPHVVVHPGAASGSRCWPPERWGRVAAALSAAGAEVVLTGGGAERELCARVLAEAERHGAHRLRDTAGRLDLPALADVVGRAALLVSGDTGVAHLATALGTPTVTLFGPTPPATWGPCVDLDRHTVLWHGDPAAPGDPHADELDPALAAITVDEVLDAAARLLAREPARTTAS
jgi:ADP-heptose:LPS heptosyltransferase